MNRAQADKFVRVFEELGDEFTYTQLGVNVLYQIATLSEAEREAEHETEKGETKTPDEPVTIRGIIPE